MSDDEGYDSLDSYDIATHRGWFQGKRDGLTCLLMLAAPILATVALIAGFIYLLIRLLN